MSISSISRHSISTCLYIVEPIVNVNSIYGMRISINHVYVLELSQEQCNALLCGNIDYISLNSTFSTNLSENPSL